jgi:hypothetical protein
MNAARTMVGAAIAGGLIWASRQPGGLMGTWDRLKSCANDVKSGEDIRTATKRFIRGEQPMVDEMPMAAPTI